MIVKFFISGSFFVFFCVFFTYKVFCCFDFCSMFFINQKLSENALHFFLSIFHESRLINSTFCENYTIFS